MKNQILLSIILAALNFTLFAQVHYAFKYQAVARVNGMLLSEQPISVQVKILKDGQAVYSESHDTITNEFGLFSLNIGMGDDPQGDFSAIKWGDGYYALKITVNGSDFPESPILAVPYALYAENAGDDGDWEKVGDTLLITGLKARIDNNLNIEDGVIRLWKYNYDTAPALQIFKHSNNDYPNQTALEVVGGVVDVQPKKFRIFTGGNDPNTLKGEIDGDFTVLNNMYVGSWDDHFVELQDRRKRIRATADPDGAMIFYTHSAQNNPRWEFRNLFDDDLKFEINGNNGDVWSQGKGSFAVVEVRGSDIIEKVNSDEALQPGEVIVIDPGRPNQARRSAQAYDRTVLGVVSGAGGVQHGMELSQKGLLDGNVSFAIAGRVYVKVTGKVEPGDLLTSSDVPGRAMVAKKRRKRDGAVIGKALSYPNEENLVLMLVLSR